MNNYVLCIIFVIFVSNGVKSEDDESPHVTLEQGGLKGTFMKSRDGRTFSAFMGIPYADKPEKFELSQPASKWSGIKDATKFGYVCPQINIAKQAYEGDEDCLMINVFTPNTTGEYPVLAFIHGGGFYFGNSNENGPKYFLDEDIVLVTFNYRLSTLGFLSTGDSELPGNLGLKDQLLALKWVQKNIHLFGGSADRTTLFGESAGGTSVAYHILSPASKGLFQNAICQSGTSLNKWAYIENPKKAANKLAFKLKCPTDSKGIKKCLKEKSAEEIIKSTLISNPLQNIVMYGPTAEPPSSHAFITEHPKVSYEAGRLNKVPLVLSVLEKEGLLIHAAVIMKDQKLIEDLNENWLERAPQYFFYDDQQILKETKDLISKRLKKFYFGDKEISQNTFENLTNAFSDSYFIYGVRNTALEHAKHAPVHLLMLGYDNLKWSQLMNMGYDKPLGMTHADDLPFLFNDLKYPPFEPKSELETMSKYFVKAWATMATKGDPNFSAALQGWDPVSKSEIESRNLKWLFIKRIPKLIVEPIGERMKFWDKVNKKLEAQPKTEL